jgi:hypothetical protein
MATLKVIEKMDDGESVAKIVEQFGIAKENCI